MFDGPYFESYYTWAASCIECDHDAFFNTSRHFPSKELCKPEWTCSLHTTRKYDTGNRSSLWRTIIESRWAASSIAPRIAADWQQERLWDIVAQQIHQDTKELARVQEAGALTICEGRCWQTAPIVSDWMFETARAGPRKGSRKCVKR